MSRERDLQWYRTHRNTLAQKYQGEWIVIFQEEVIASFLREEDAVNFSVERYGINEASIFQATATDPILFA